MKDQDKRIHLLETLRTLDYQIIDYGTDCEQIAALTQQREELRTQLNALLCRAS
jgi:hypothetical protein